MKIFLNLVCIFLFSNTLSAYQPLPKVTYTFTNDLLDVVIPCHEKDKHMLDMIILQAKKNVINIGDIYVISDGILTNQAKYVDEKKFPFTKKQVALEIFGNEKDAQQFIDSPETRIGWLYQQLLKWYIFQMIPGISSNVLVLDADTLLLKPIRFLDENNNGLFNVGDEYNGPYFEHARRVLGLRRVFPQFSGICHHMVFQRPVIKDFFYLVYQKHHEELWKVLCRSISITDIYDSTMSEYELYFNFCFNRSNQFKVRRLKWKEVGADWSKCLTDPELDYITSHVRPGK